MIFVPNRQLCPSTLNLTNDFAMATQEKLQNPIN